MVVSRRQAGRQMRGRLGRVLYTTKGDDGKINVTLCWVKNKTRSPHKSQRVGRRWRRRVAIVDKHTAAGRRRSS